MVDWITKIISSSGYVGIFLLMLAENLFPPIPSELIMPLAGFVAAQGELHPILVGLAGTGGSVLGALLWYYIGKWLGKERVCNLAARYGRWLTLDEKDVGKAITWFERHGGKAVFIGRLVPAVRTLISVPAGIAHMAMGPFLLASTSGTVIWISCLTAAGVFLKSEYQLVSNYIDSASKIILGLIVLTYIYRVMAGGRLGDKVRQWAQRMYRDVHTIYLAARDSRMPWYARLLALLIAAYVVSPVDLIPDFIPILGHLDDALLVPLGIWVTMRLTPGTLLQEHRQHAATFAEQPRQWWVGMVFVALWAIVMAFAVRWLMKVFTGE
jgi:membrane protein DedA with SNARE-associated domain/uncharacterized membrane protein YkvA (DUF1232 family)